MAARRRQKPPSQSPEHGPGATGRRPAPEAEARQRLLDLAYDVSLRLRHHVQPAVRISAALLLATSLAACDGDPDENVAPTTAAVQPLQQEVATGLPTRPGRYPLVASSLQRDAQGVYGFAYQPAGGASSAVTASASRVRLAEGDREELEIPARGDPILHLRRDSAINLVSAEGLDAIPTLTPGIGGGRSTSSSSHTYWRPMYAGGGGAAYYDPPRQIASGGTVDEARRSSSLAPASERTYSGVRAAVAGRAGGAGSGTAASNRAGVDTSSRSGAAAAAAGGVAASKSSGFSGGAASAKSSGSS